jgi:Domain of unknown function (DUF4282)
MSVTIHCPHCGATGNAPDHIIGQSVRCSKCKQSFVAGGGEGQDEDELPEESGDGQFGDIDDMPEPPKRGKGRSRSSSGGGGSSMGDVLMFRTFLSPILVIILYWLGVVGSVGYGLMFMLLLGMSGNVMLVLTGIFGGVLMIVIGLIVVRVGCEAIMVQFRIHEQLKQLNETMKPKA